ncbi:YhdH/YhfP family quinone oxidoreductase [Mucilaginibacter robiniae]|uniref:YhdH/YhfP family quinone oxidoreductase n=1 Tax=Mucilaginibacter robiniae TaxID=2728022 RepID=A0A7L5E0G5_9SPHI|nr:YhdH/YhfP family quinone oxidoreductase [Mucilaginibacter robiniae]QJD95024.1 YhdH/YhfP family quinone oxidoreductase [Mucilaginibacter robiniae]
MEQLFNALLITEQDGMYVKEIKQVNTNQLPDNDLLIRVKYSSINFKDALSATGNKGVTKKYPHVPGIDAAGVIVQSKVPEFAVDTEVLVTGFDLGMNTWGGFGEYISIPASWAVALPDGLSMQEAMCFGTAGLTAALSVQALLKARLVPATGKVAVSGATGGVGSMAVAILAKLGFDVTAVSGKEEDGFLIDTLGAQSVITRESFTQRYNSKPLTTPAFAAGIDTVGGAILSAMLKATHYGGTVTCCGMVASADLNTSIFPFILRGVSLVGIDSVQAPMQLRQYLWQQLATDWKPANLHALIQEISLTQLPEKLDAIYQGKAKGRYVLKHNTDS